MMAGSFNDLPERALTVERKLDTLSASVDARFDAVDEALVEQRRYTEFAFQKTEFAFQKLDAKMDERFDRLEARFARFERKLDRFIDT
jgi:hypothetical protein